MYKVGLQSTKIKKQKPVQTEKLVPNLSQLYIQIPKPQFHNKISSVNHTQISQHISFQQNYFQNDDQSNKASQNLIFSNKVDSNQFIFSNTKTKNSISSASKNYRSQSEIIKQWIKNMFQKKGLLGVNWQQKFRKKKKSLLKQAFQCIKEENKSQSIYLQTQSKYKSYFKKDHHLIQIALETLKGLNNKLIFKIKRQAFSMILRYLIFMPQNHKNELKQSRIIYQSITPTSHRNQHLRQSKSFKKIHSKNINIKILSPSHKQIKNDHKSKPNNMEYITNQQNKQQQIKKSMYVIENEYALNPLSPSKFKSDKLNQQCQIKIKQKGNFHLQNIILQNKQVPNIAIRHSPLAHNKFLDHDHNNTPQTPKKTNQNYICAPLTPKRIIINQLQTNNGIFNQINHYQYPNHYLDNRYQNMAKTNYKDGKNSNKKQEHYLRDSNSKRPNSHNPFANIIHQPILNDAIQNDIFINKNSNGLKKSRSISLSGNMKVQFINSNKNLLNIGQNNLLNQNNDYQDDYNKLKLNTEKLIGNFQSKKIRENYQKNSYSNELIQDQIVHHNEAYIKSNPISPRYCENYVNKLNEQQFYYVKSQDHVQNSPKSSHNIFGRHSFIPITKQKEKDQQKNIVGMRKSMQLNNNVQNLGKKINKDKLAITQKLRYN